MAYSAVYSIYRLGSFTYIDPVDTVMVTSADPVLLTDTVHTRFVHTISGRSIKGEMRNCESANLATCKVQNKIQKHFIADTQSALVTDWFYIFPSHCTLHSFMAVVSIQISSFAFLFRTLYIVNFALL